MKRQLEGALWTRWRAQEKRLGDRPVLIEAASGEAWNAPQLSKRALEFCGELERFRPGERIAFRLPNGAEWMVIFLALQKARLAAVPLDGAMPDEGCLETAQRLGVRAVYFNDRWHELDGGAVRRSNIACVKLTSGSGALPKAIECRAGHLIADGENIARTMSIRRGDINLAAIPLGHSYGLGNLVMLLINQGTAMVTAREYTPRQLIEWIKRYRVTVFPTVPAILRVLAALPPGEGKLPSLRTMISAGAMLTPAVAQAFHQRFGVKVHNFYGSSETGAICYDRTGAASLTGCSVGKPFHDVSVTIHSGRVTVASKSVATRTGRWRLNDLGEWNARKELVLLGRVGQGANIGGKKVHPLEIEQALRTLPGVSDAVVWLGQLGGRDILTAAAETSVTQGEIERALAAKLPAWKLPKTYLVLPSFPRNARGKIDHTALRQLFPG